MISLSVHTMHRFLDSTLPLFFFLSFFCYFSFLFFFYLSFSSVAMLNRIYLDAWITNGALYVFIVIKLMNEKKTHDPFNPLPCQR